MTDAEDLHQSLEELRRTVADNSDLLKDHEAVLGAVSAQVAQTHRDIADQLSRMSHQQAGLVDQVDRIRADLGTFIEDNGRDMRRLIAYGQLADVQRQLDVKYGPYKQVRDNVLGILEGMDHGLVQESTMQLIAEFRSVDVPDYWLASMLNATVAWIRDERPATERALMNAMRLDRTRSALFAALLSARYGRFDTANEWLHTYLSSQQPERLADDFVVLLDATVSGALGAPARQQINDRCQSWFQQLARDPQLADRQLNRWRKVLDTHTPAAPDAIIWQEWPALTAVGAPWHRLTDQLGAARAFDRLHRTFRQRSVEDADSGPDRTAQVKRVDRMLRQMVDLPEPEERRLRLQEMQLKRLAGLDDGHDEPHDQQVSQNPEETHVDFLTLLSNLGARRRPFPQAGRGTVRLASWLCRRWAIGAVEEAADRISTTVDQGLPVAVGPWQGRISVESVTDDLVDELSVAFDRHTRQEVRRERLGGWLVVTGTLAVLGAAVFASTLVAGWRFGSAPAFGLFVLTLAAALFALMIHVTAPAGSRRPRSALPRRRRRRSSGCAPLSTSTASFMPCARSGWNRRGS
ncbi:hypothetical protein [Actinoplanes sp. CA-252034]|uniref:hypothetical protein n=1 Tax=Actinoplanes sp. CA-252034 TaxID=3239906 RepID=UPI003D972DD3